MLSCKNILYLVSFRRLLKQSSEAVEREKQLKEIERLYLNLRQVVSKQPGAEIQSELIKTQRALVVKKNKMKVWQQRFRLCSSLTLLFAIVSVFGS